MKDEGKGAAEGSVGAPSVQLMPMLCFIKGHKPVS
jgi:hypothetical protein